MAQHDKDILISRIVDDEATAEDWAALKELAAGDPTVWRDLAEAQYTGIGLASAVQAAIEIADEVEAPVHEHMRARMTLRAGTAAKWGGWLAAAAVTLAWLGAGRAGPGGSTAGFGPSVPGTVADAFKHYVDMGKQSGQVVEEVPQLVLVETKRVEGGPGYEVLYIRQVIERAIVDDLYGLGQDETGRPARIRLEVMPTGGSTGPM
jgi:hypothetical protein